MKTCFPVFCFTVLFTQCSSPGITQKTWSDNIRVVLENTSTLMYDRGKRLPLYLWPAMDPGKLSSDSAELLVMELDRRGIGLVCSGNDRNTNSIIGQCLPVARAQKKLGLKININATSLLDSFYTGDERTAHVDRNGKRFFDDSFGDHKMGCPFALDLRKKEIRERVRKFVKKYHDQGLAVDFIFTDWEIDGPLEVNRAFESSKKCARCCRHLGDNFSFEEFQKTMREMRSYLQYYAYVEPVLSVFPSALIGNYAVYPNDGYRYRYDYGNTDYRWFYNMLLVACNAFKNTSFNIPVISFVHWNTVFASGTPDNL